MNIIPQSEVKRKRVKVIRGGLGFVIEGQRERWHGVAMPKRTRGDISGFSVGAKRRMRATMALAKPRQPSDIYGFCFTIPGKTLTPREVRNIWGAFVDRFAYQWRDVPMVWRIELQRRKQAHWHCVIWIPHGDVPTAARAVMIAEDWRRIVRARVGALSRRTDEGFDLYGVDIKSLNGASATGIIGYICDHASKHKRAQLGWQGRQWGVVNRAALCFDGEQVFEATPEQHKQAARQFRRLQEHLRRDGVYTGGNVAPSGNVMRSIFGRDAERLLKCYKLTTEGNR